MKKTLFLSIFCLVGFFCVADFAQKQTKGFTQGKIAAAFPLDSQFPVNGEKEALLALDQPFHFLRKGNSAFVLVSEDQKYVLKFLRKSKIFAPFWTQIQPVHFLLPSYCNKVALERQKEKDQMTLSYFLAAHAIAKQTGLLYAHLSPTSHLCKKITFYDKIKVKHTLSMDTVAFALQRKAEPFCAYFKSIDLDEKKLLLKEFAGILLERAQNGIYDLDLSPHYNLGIFEGHFMTFDLDGLKACSIPSSPKELEAHMMKDGKKMIKWLKSVQKDLPSFLEKEITKLAKLSCLKDPTSLE